MRYTTELLRAQRLLTTICYNLTIVLSLGGFAFAQPREQELFKVGYGDQAQLLRMVFRPARDDAEEGEEDPPYGGVDNFCASWDGQLFYFCDVMRGSLKSDDEENGAVSNSQEKSPPWIQVYNRKGQWVRTIKIVKGNPSYFRVDREGRLYVSSDDSVEVYNPDGSYNKLLSERLKRAVRAAQVQYNLTEQAIFREVDSQGRIYLWVFRKPEATSEGESRHDQLLVVAPNGETRLIPIESYNPLGVDRHRGEIITANYQRPFIEGYIREHETIIYDLEERRELRRERCDLYASLPYKVVDSRGEVVRSFSWKVDISQHAAGLFDAYNITYGGRLPDDVMTDSRGHLYRVYLAPRIDLYTVDRFSSNGRFEGWLTMYRGFAIVEFDSQGRFLGVRAQNLPLETDFANRLWDVDRDGNVYWVEFQSDHLRVMMSPRQ